MLTFINRWGVKLLADIVIIAKNLNRFKVIGRASILETLDLNRRVFSIARYRI